jgi:hypothetical protein
LITKICLFAKVPVPESTLYFAVKVFEPAVKVTAVAVEPLEKAPDEAVKGLKALSSDAEEVVAPEIAKDIKHKFEVLELLLVDETITNAFVPVVTVTAGPEVVKSVYEIEVVVWLVATLSKSFAGTPLAGVAHFNPVVSALSATNLIQEQSQRIVLGA